MNDLNNGLVSNTLKVLNSPDLADSLSTGDIGYVPSTGDFLIKKANGLVDTFNSTTTDCSNSHDYYIDNNIFRGNFDYYNSVIDERKLKEIVEESGLAVTEEIRENNTSHIGWILIDEKYISNNYLVRSTKISGKNPLEEGLDISVWIIERNGYLQLFLTPESIGTRWEFEEFRELFTDIFNKYVEYLENLGKNTTLDPFIPDSIDIETGIRDINPPWWRHQVIGGPTSDDVILGGTSIYDGKDISMCLEDLIKPNNDASNTV